MGGGQKVGVIVIVDTGSVVSVNVVEGMGLSKAGTFVAEGKQPTSVAKTSNRIKIVICFIRYPI